MKAPRQRDELCKHTDLSKSNTKTASNSCPPPPYTLPANLVYIDCTDMFLILSEIPSGGSCDCDGEKDCDFMTKWRKAKKGTRGLAVEKSFGKQLGWCSLSLSSPRPIEILHEDLDRRATTISLNASPGNS